MNQVEVRVAALLHSYTRGASVVRATGATLGEVLDDLDRRFPGIRFRVVDEQDRLRPHVRFFVNGTDARDIAVALSEGDEVYIVGALSGGDDGTPGRCRPRSLAGPGGLPRVTAFTLPRASGPVLNGPWTRME